MRCCLVQVLASARLARVVLPLGLLAGAAAALLLRSEFITALELPPEHAEQFGSPGQAHEQAARDFVPPAQAQTLLLALHHPSGIRWLLSAVLAMAVVRLCVCR